MKKTEQNYMQNAKENMEQLSKGAFLTTKADGKVNTMTIGWGAIGNQWGKPIFTVMVRKSRLTYEMIEKAGEFTVTIPYGDAKAPLGVCGSKSGRDIDKIKECGFDLLEGEAVNTPVLGIAGMSFECRTVYSSPMDKTALNADYDAKWYAGGDYHTFYCGEILKSYIIE